MCTSKPCNCEVQDTTSYVVHTDHTNWEFSFETKNTLPGYHEGTCCALRAAHEFGCVAVSVLLSGIVKKYFVGVVDASGYCFTHTTRDPLPVQFVVLKILSPLELQTCSDMKLAYFYFQCWKLCSHWEYYYLPCRWASRRRGRRHGRVTAVTRGAAASRGCRRAATSPVAGCCARGRANAVETCGSEWPLVLIRALFIHLLARVSCELF